MEVIALADGRSWNCWQGGREVGLVRALSLGKGNLKMFAAYSGVTARERWDLGVHVTLEVAVARVEAFNADPEAFLARSHRVVAEAVGRRR